MAELLVELLERCRQSDPDAIATLVQRFQAWAIDLAEALLGDAHLAEDAVQSAFIRAFTQLADLRDSAAFPGWFRQIIRTECHRIARQRRPAESLLESIPSADLTPFDQAESQERRRLVHEALASLSPPARQAADLYYLDQCGCAEVADRLGIPQGTVKRRLHDARAQLRQLLLDGDAATPRQCRTGNNETHSNRRPLPL